MYILLRKRVRLLHTSGWWLNSQTDTEILNHTWRNAELRAHTVAQHRVLYFM